MPAVGSGQTPAAVHGRLRNLARMVGRGGGRSQAMALPQCEVRLVFPAVRPTLQDSESGQSEDCRRRTRWLRQPAEVGRDTAAECADPSESGGRPNDVANCQSHQLSPTLCLTYDFGNIAKVRDTREVRIEVLAKLPPDGRSATGRSGR